MLHHHHHHHHHRPAHHDFQGALVRVSGTNSTATAADVKERPFFTQQGADQTSFSASGIHFSQRNVIVTVASVLAPFLTTSATQRARSDSTVHASWSFPLLKRDTHILVSFEQSGQPVQWKKAELISLLNIAPTEKIAPKLTGNQPRNRSRNRNAGINFATLAVLRLTDDPLPLTRTRNRPRAPSVYRSTSLAVPARATSPPERGDVVDIIASPFGLVSPAVFRNTLSTGVISNIVYASAAAVAATTHRAATPHRAATTNRHGASNVPTAATHTVHKYPVLLLTDAAIFPGSEGGAAISHDRSLCGIVASPLKREDGSFVELAAIIPAHLFMHRLGTLKDSVKRTPSSASVAAITPPPPLLLSYSPSALSPTTTLSTTPTSATSYRGRSPTLLKQSIARGNRSLVCVRAGAAWGSGVIISRHGHIITCAHLIKPVLVAETGTQTPAATSNPHHLRTLQRVKVRVDAEMAHSSHSQTATWHHATVLFCSKGALDLACIQLLDGVVPKESLPIEIDDVNPVQGSPAVVIGHALFDPQSALSATVSVGSVAKVTPFLTKPMILQTSASVYRGDSGGMVVSGTTGKLLGMITSNARQTDSIIPKLNFSIPSRLLHPRSTFTAQGQGGLHEWFETFEMLSNDLNVRHLWDLENTEESILHGLDQEMQEEEQQRTERIRPKL